MSSHSSYKKVDDQLTSSSNPQKLSNYPIISQPPETLHINSEYLLPTSTYPSPESIYEYPSHYLNSHYPEQNSDPTFPGKDIDRRALSFILHLRSFASACLPSTLAYISWEHIHPVLESVFERIDNSRNTNTYFTRRECVD